MPAAGLAIAVGLGLDRVLGEPPTSMHPVARFGQAMTALENRIHRDDRVRGTVFCAVGVGGAAALGVALRRIAGPGPATAVAIAVAAAGRMLGREANAIGGLLVDGDLAAARERLPTLVGRTATGLSESDVARAVIESVAENSVDAVIAPIVWAAIGGAPAVLAHRAVNTLDAMVGHRTPRHERFGWASARLDDVANWLPARVAALFVAVVRPRRATAVWRVVRRDSGRHPSPNGGVIEAAYAAALDIRLGGTNRYGDVIEDRGQLGDGDAARPADVARAVALLDRVTLAFALLGLARSGSRTLARRQRGGSVVC